MSADEEKQPPERPEYKVYRSRSGLLGRLKRRDLDALREREKAPKRAPEGKPPKRGEPDQPARREPRGGDEKPGRRLPLPAPGRRRWLRWLGLAAASWLLLSAVNFVVSAQLQTDKLPSGASDLIGGSPDLVTHAQTLLVLGTDTRPKGSGEPGANQGPPRADTIMLLRIGGGSFRKLSIPRDSYAAIPGHDSQKINAAFAFGGPKLQIQAVEDFMGINVDHVVLVDFTGFQDFIDAIGGVKVNVKHRLCADINGGVHNGGSTLHLNKGERTLNGFQALIYARARENSCGSASDLTRAAHQQEVLSGIKGRLISPIRLPYNFIKGPWIAWSAPRAIVSDMGAFTMPQLLLAALIGHNTKPDVLKPSCLGCGPGGSLIVPESERQRAKKRFLGG